MELDDFDDELDFDLGLEGLEPTNLAVGDDFISKLEVPDRCANPGPSEEETEMVVSGMVVQALAVTKIGLISRVDAASDSLGDDYNPEGVTLKWAFNHWVCGLGHLAKVTHPIMRHAIMKPRTPIVCQNLEYHLHITILI